MRELIHRKETAWTGSTSPDRSRVVTGAGGGTRARYCLELAARGAAVVANDLGGSTTGEGGPPTTPIASSTRSAPPAAGPSPTTTASPPKPAARRSSRRALSAFGRVDIVDQQRRQPAQRRASANSARPTSRRCSRSMPRAPSSSRSRPIALMCEQGYGRIVLVELAVGHLRQSDPRQLRRRQDRDDRPDERDRAGGAGRCVRQLPVPQRGRRPPGRKAGRRAARRGFPRGRRRRCRTTSTA